MKCDRCGGEIEKCGYGHLKWYPQWNSICSCSVVMCEMCVDWILDKIEQYKSKHTQAPDKGKNGQKPRD